MRTTLVLLSLLLQLTAVLASYETAWNDWKIQHHKTYAPEEELVRKAIFQKNLDYINVHNQQYAMGQVTFNLALNKFADLKLDEFNKLFKGFSNDKQPPMPAGEFVYNVSEQLPATVDWRTKGIVTPVKNQQTCGSCWAFSSTGALEGQVALKTGRLISLSEQNLVDCDTDDDGCDGGLMEQAFNWIQKNKGIDTESSYPYTGVGGSCQFKPQYVGASDAGFVRLLSGSENTLKAAVAIKGPVSIAIDASSPSFQFYSSGVYVETYCSSTSLDHGVLAVGYGTLNGLDYWLVKNSWSEQWGLSGYILMARNRNNQCGVATMASYPLV